MRLLLATLFCVRSWNQREREARREVALKKVDSNAKGCSALSELAPKKAAEARGQVHALVTIKELPDKKKC